MIYTTNMSGNKFSFFERTSNNQSPSCNLLKLTDKLFSLIDVLYCVTTDNDVKRFRLKRKDVANLWNDVTKLFACDLGKFGVNVDTHYRVKLESRKCSRMMKKSQESEAGSSSWTNIEHAQYLMAQHEFTYVPRNISI